MRLKYIPRNKLIVLTALFFGSGITGMISGIEFGGGFVITVFAAGIFSIGGVTGWMLLTQGPRSRDERKKKRRHD